MSRLAAQEFSDYQLLQLARKDFHDRNLRVDAAVYTLGPGVDSAGVAPTNFAPADSTTHGHAELDALIGRARVIHPVQSP